MSFAWLDGLSGRIFVFAAWLPAVWSDYIWHFWQLPAIEFERNVFGGALPVLMLILKKTVVLVGMMGSGKTAVGSALARILKVPFLDSDTEITRAANMSIAEIFERDGEAFFRTKENQVLTRLLETERGILATGGGAFMAADNRRVIAEMGVAVWLRADHDLLWTRGRHKTTRPLLHTSGPRATLIALCRQREPLYALADLVVDARPDYSIEDMAGKVIEVLCTRSDVLEKT